MRLIYHQKVGSKQKPPYLMPLAYTMRKVYDLGPARPDPAYSLGNPVFSGYRYPGSGNSNETAPRGLAYANAHNKALSKLNDKLGVAQGFFESWYERKAAISLIESSVSKLIYFARNYKKPRKMMKLFGKKAKGIKPKNLPEAWIGFHFGIKPLYMDINAAVNLLNRDFPTAAVYGSSGYTDDFITKSSYGGQTLFANYKFKGFVKHGVLVYGVNPNMDLAARVGLDKPITSLYAVLPFSWAVDYFFNVGELLSNMEPRFPGLKLKGGYTTDLINGSHSAFLRNSKGVITNRGGSSGTYMKRTLVTRHHFIPTMNLNPLNPQRSSYLLSVMALIMSGKKK